MKTIFANQRLAFSPDGGLEPPTSRLLSPLTALVAAGLEVLRAIQLRQSGLDCKRWGSNPRIRRYSNLSRAPWTTRPRLLWASVLLVLTTVFGLGAHFSDTGTRTPARGVKTLDPNQLDYIGWLLSSL